MGWKFSFGSKTPLDSRSAANDAIRQNLASYGDDGRAVRHVLHYAYPTEKADNASRVGMIVQLGARGFEIKDAASKGGLILEHYRPVAANDFDKFSSDLEDWFNDRGWEYDGWECAVVRGGLN